MLPGAGSYTHGSTGLHDDYTNYEGDCMGVTADGVDAVFAISVAAGEILDVKVTSDAQSDPVLVLSSACGDPVATCLVYGDSGVSGDPESVTYTNATAAAQTIYIIADNYDAFAGGPIKLDVKLHTPVCGDGIIDGAETCDDMNATAGDGCTACAVDPGHHCGGAPSVCTADLPGETCGNAITVSASGTFNGTYTGYFNDYDPQSGGCTSSSEAGLDIAYKVTLAAGQVLNATLTPDATLMQDVALYVLTDCAAPTTACVAGSDGGFSGDPESVSYTATAAQTVYVIVDGYDATTLAGAYALDVSIVTPVCGDGMVQGAETCDDMNATANDGCTACKIDAGYHCTGAPSVCAPAPAGDLCGNAIKITASGTVAGTFTGAAGDYDPGDLGCTMFSEVGPDIAYKIDMTAGQKLTATLTPDATAMQDVALYVLTDCADPVNACPIGADDGASGQPETLMYTAAAAQTVYLIVDAYASTVTGPYSLNVLLQ
jgi:cysteine-rich repeat protein